MQDTIKMIHLKEKNTGKTIHTTLTDPIREILENDGFKWFEPLKGPIELSQDAFCKIESLISPEPG